METRELQNERELIEQLEVDVAQSKKKRVIFQAGHFPLVYTRSGSVEGIREWGDFSKYSLDLAAKIARNAKNMGLEVGFAIIVDDKLNEGLSKIGKSQRSAIRNRLYKSKNGINALLPEEFERILHSQGFSASEILRADHCKRGRESCLYFSEKVLIAQSPPEMTECARAYHAFIDRQITPSDYLVSFVPDRCTGNICRGVLENLKQGISASHIFMQTDSTLLRRTGREEIWKNWGVHYRRD